MEKLFTSPTFLLIAQVLFLIGFAIVLVIFFKKLFKRNPADPPYLYQSRLIAIGLTAIAFNLTLSRIVLHPIIICINGITGLLNHMPTDPNYISGQTSSDITQVGSSFSMYFQYFPLGKLLLAIGVAIVLYHFIAYCFVQLKTSTTTTAPVQGQNAFLYNAVILAVLAFSLFLVISVFISIPYLNEIKKPSQFSKTGLDSALNSIRLSDSTFTKKDPGVSPFPLVSLKDTLLKDSAIHRRYNLLPTTKQKELESIISSIDEQAKLFAHKRNESLNNLNNTVDQYIRDKPANKEKLVRNFERYAQSNAVDKDLLYTTSVNVYQGYIRDFRNSFNLANIDFAENDMNNATEYSRLMGVLKSTINSFFNDKDSLISVAYIPSIPTYFDKYENDNIDISLNDVNVIASKRDGSDWGFFGWIARFLIKTESLDLVLLIGMLGFGLLGASFSSFQTPPPPKDENENNGYVSFIDTFRTKPIIKDFWNVLARGFSAAILIYLATKGGIAIITANTSADPNGYVLLFLCFIGAVFSEKVWAKAKEKYNL